MIKKLFNAVFVLLILTSFSAANEKIDETIDKTTDFLKSISKRSLNKSETAEFLNNYCLLYTSPSPRDVEESRMPSSA